MNIVKKVDLLQLSPYVRFVHENAHPGTLKYKVPPRIIYDHELIYVVKGVCHYTIEGEAYTLKAGDIHYMPPHTHHSCHVPEGEPFHYFAVHFDFVYMGESLDFSADDVYINVDYPHLDLIPVQEHLADRPIVEFSDVRIPYLIHPQDSPRYMQPFRELLAVFTDKAYGYHLAMRGCLLKILSYILQDISTETGVNKHQPHWKKLHHTIAYMKENYNQNLDFNDIAQSLHLSANYFRTIFKNATGKSPLEFLIGLRMEKAKQLLLEDKLPIGKISELVGYADIHYFSKLFKKIEGLSPKSFADSVRTYRK